MSDTKSKINPGLLQDINHIIHTPIRLMIMMYLYTVESVDYVFLRRMTNLTWGSLATHINKLEEANYIEVDKGYRGKKPHSMIRMTEQGRNAFKEYKDRMEGVFSSIED